MESYFETLKLTKITYKFFQNCNLNFNSSKNSFKNSM